MRADRLSAGSLGRLARNCSRRAQMCRFLRYLIRMKTSHLLSFLCGSLLALGLATVSQTKASGPNHVFELRVYHAAPGKLDALKTRFGDHTDTIFKKHNMK